MKNSLHQNSYSFFTPTAMSDDEAPSLTFSQMLEQRKSGFAKRPTDEPTSIPNFYKMRRDLCE